MWLREHPMHPMHQSHASTCEVAGGDSVWHHCSCCMQDANAELSSETERKVAEAARLQAVNSRLRADNDKLRDEVSPHSPVFTLTFCVDN
jgi:hypothetical protein